MNILLPSESKIPASISRRNQKASEQVNITSAADAEAVKLSAEKGTG
jgi:hypothetical protein